ncbi:similar to Saccharomyces cerevisiae YDL088C ASM4 Nuclear pore complex subunit, part of a subcomplex also containing Nup53p, Nup170p, and Pse1p [Maudiozyma saulgeensis]|uniref:Similar to Saccharomyces cerevisiae YDL088C ASM4 Nuclear pore complex subunit, part of a subcomplex also containing Nup53p, Nup170p, and Pse1p n=1 Tax=Maudiozyma saulgeensis TaxID=1789683 RepID=A0A1X7R0H7_9SACH|nr:similar to Saccharomyces cerevisiae YDL088C ASM4 Nuclear pore complex subunit, part of a subcomplex also containing Nup53p, Nup170p, and Pse1p [Kazachstania saulgeensis]
MNSNRFANVSVLSQQQNGQNMTQTMQQQSTTPITGTTTNSTTTHGQPTSGTLNPPSVGSFGQFSSGLQNSQQFQGLPSVSNNGNTSQKDPSWFNNPTKRAIPQNIVKRTIRPQSDSGEITHSQSTTALSSRSGFDTMSFGSRKNKPIFSSSNLQSLNTDNILSDSNEAPPTVSIHDWQSEDQFGNVMDLGVNGQNQFENQSILMSNTATPRNDNSKKIPNLFKNSNAFDRTPQSNIFNKNKISDTTGNEGSNTTTSSSILSDNKSNGSKLFNFFGPSNNKGKSGTPDPLSPTTTASTQSLQTQAQQETAIIVFGYPESISNLIITHFSHFGSILEDFQVLRSISGINVSTLKNKNQNSTNNNDDRKYPIFTGEGWVKITYDSRQSAIRALQENGSVFSGTLIGCVPYSKNAVEKLASCKIDKLDNIGENDIAVSGTISPLQSFGTETNAYDIEDKNFRPSSSNENKSTDKTSPINNENNQIMPQNVFLPNHKLTINDGKSLFVHNTDTNNHNFLQDLENKMRRQETPVNAGDRTQNNGVLHSVNNWLFGWNNL